MSNQQAILREMDQQGSAPSANGFIKASTEALVYEQPLNERTRTFLRLEFLFRQLHAHTFRHSAWDSRAALNTLFDIVNIFARADLKTDVMKELERQAGFLERLAQNPQVDRSRLEEILNEMDVLIDRLHGVQSTSFDLRGNELLNSIKQRSSISGGCCDFDLPVYHFWLTQPEEKRIIDIQKWIEPFEPIQNSLKLILRLIRESGITTTETAASGFFQKSLDAGSTTQIIRVSLPPEAPYFAEISGGKHRFTIRFMEPHIYERPQQTRQDVNFQLTCCMF